MTKPKKKEKPWIIIDDYPPESHEKATCPECGSKRMRYTDEWQRCLDCRRWWIWN